MQLALKADPVPKDIWRRPPMSPEQVMLYPDAGHPAAAPSA